MPKMNPNDKVESKRLAMANAAAKRKDENYWKTEGPKVKDSYKKNRAEFEKKLAYDNSKSGRDARIAKQKNK